MTHVAPKFQIDLWRQYYCRVPTVVCEISGAVHWRAVAIQRQTERRTDISDDRERVGKLPKNHVRFVPLSVSHSIEKYCIAPPPLPGVDGCDWRYKLCKKRREMTIMRIKQIIISVKPGRKTKPRAWTLFKHCSVYRQPHVQLNSWAFG